MIQSYIDLDNGDGDQDRGNGEGARVNLPPSELIKLGEWRRREYSQRTREQRDLELAKMEEAKAIADSLEGQPRDSERPYALPEGAALRDIWELILDYICDLEDIIPVRETCQLFRSLLERKYVAFRLNEVVTKFANEVGDLNTLLNFRLVSRSSKAAVDKLFVTDTNEQPSFFLATRTAVRIPKPRPLWLETARLDELHPIMAYLESQNIRFPFPVRMMTIEYSEYDGDLNHPDLLVLRTQFERLLGFVGNRIRSFKFCCTEDNLESYNRLKGWVALMPNLVELAVEADIGVVEPPPNPVALQPFPTCSMLRRFFITWYSNILAPSVNAEILRANPTISEVIHYYMGSEFDWDLWKEEEFNRSVRSLDARQLTRFDVLAPYRIPPLLESRYAWPLKQLFLTCEGRIPSTVIPSSKSLIGFVNSLGNTLEELKVNWKMRDTGGYLVLPKLSKLMWKVWPEFMNLEFAVGIENLQHFDLDLTACAQLNDSFENAKGFIDEFNLPSLLPALKQIRVKIGFVLYSTSGHWRTVWKS